jgi:hypothetical protein
MIARNTGSPSREIRAHHQRDTHWNRAGHTGVPSAAAKSKEIGKEAGDAGEPSAKSKAAYGGKESRFRNFNESLNLGNPRIRLRSVG